MTGSVWTVAEQVDGRLRTVSYELLARGRDLADKLAALAKDCEPKPELCAVVMGDRIELADIEELIQRGADRVLVVRAPGLDHQPIEPCVNVLEHLVREREPSVLLAGATTFGRCLMPSASRPG